MCNSVPKQIDHSIVIVGYGTDPVHGDYWNVKNSWSKAFANDGFIRVARGVNCGDIDCALLKEATVSYTPDTHPLSQTPTLPHFTPILKAVAMFLRTAMRHLTTSKTNVGKPEILF